jgi:RNA polymerase-binding transcription factor DksA
MEVSGMHQATAEKLRERLEELRRRAGVIEDDLRHPLDADSSEQAVDLADDEALVGVNDVLRQEMADIRAALSRLEEGSYGTCTRCGEPISSARLDALPTATRCVACA